MFVTAIMIALKQYLQGMGHVAIWAAELWAARCAKRKY